LGQDGTAVSFRVRTPVSGPNGNARDADASWPNVFLNAQFRHLIVTYARGELRLYLNGEPYGRPWRMQAMHRLPGGSAEPNATMAMAAVLLILPLGLVGPAAWDRARRPRLAVTAWLAAGGLAVLAFDAAAGPMGGWFAAAALAAGLLLALASMN